MKKLLLFVIACTLGLFGTVNAQETITIGEGGTTNGALPVDFYNGYGICQQLFTADEIGHTDGGVITSMAIKFFGETTTGEPANPTTATFERKVDIYINSTELAELEGGVNLSAGQTPYFQGTVTYVPEEWTEFVFDTPYQYDGGNIIITMHDYTGGDYQNWYHFYADFIGKRAAYANITTKLTNEYLESNLSSLLWLSPSRNNIQLTFAAAGEGGEEPEPTPDPEPTPEPEPGDDLVSTFEFNFNDGSMEGWRLIDDDNDGHNWKVDNSSTYGGVDETYGLASSCYESSELYPDNYIVTESKYLITETSVFSFVHIQSDAMYYNENIGVVVSENNTDWTVVWSEKYAAPNTDWKEANISLAAYAGKEVYLGFRHYDCNGADASGIRIDNVKLYVAEEGGETPEPEPVAPAAPVVEATVTETTVTLTWAAVENATYYNIYTPSGFAENILGLEETTYTFEGLTAGTEYCFEVSAGNDVDESDTTEACATTTEAEIEEPTVDLTKQYRVKATSSGKYLYVMDNDAHATGPQGGVVVYQTMNDNAQLFTLEDAGDGAYYFKSATGYYIYCQAWNVDAYSTTEKTALKMVDQGDGTFRLQNTNNDKYFKVEQVGMFYFPFCDCDGTNCTIETWTLEAVEGGEEPEPTPDPEPEGDMCVIDITLKDSYGDGWNGNYLLVEYNGVSQQIDFYGSGTSYKEKVETLELPQGAHAKVTFTVTGGYSYPSENSFIITYEGGKEIINSPQGAVLATTSFEFDVNCIPTAPEKPVVVATPTGGSTIVLAFTAADADTYTIYNGTEVVATGVTETTYTVEGLTADTEYCYTVVASNEIGDSEVSEAACATTFAEGTVIVSVGEGNIAQMSAPIYNAGPGAVYSLSQQIYTAEEIGIDGNADIFSISFHHVTGNNNVRDIVVYMQNVDVAAYTDNKGWITFSDSDKVYEGEFNFGMAEDWVTIDFQNKFEYKGGNIAVTVYDKKGVGYGYSYDICDKFYSSQINEWRGLYYTKTSELDFSQLSTFYGTTMNTGNYGSPANVYYINNIKLRTLAGEAPTAPAAPVVAATALSDTEIALTWETVEDALSYNIYSADTLVANVTELTYTVTGLTAETEYTFVVKAVNEVGESEASNVATATTLVPAPTFADYRLESVAKTWGATEYVYDEEMANTVVAVVEDGVSTEISYNEADQIESAIVYAEEVDSIGNPIEYSSVRYTYNEDGVWVGYKEITQGWMGRVEETNATLNYNENGQLVSVVTDELIQEVTYNEAGLIAEVLASKAVVEDGEEEGEGGFDDGGVVPVSEEENEEDAEEGTEEETVMYTDKKVFEYDEEGRLVKKSTYFYYGEFVLGEVEVYEYDENGNCVSMETYEADEETGELREYPWAIKEYFYDLTINNEDVYSFDYPHFAFINWVEPSHVNILTKVMTYNQYFDEEIGELVGNSYDVTAYNYNPEVLSAPLAPMNVQAEVTSAESIELSWAGFADAETFTIYSADTVYAEGLVDPYYTIEGLEMNVDYCFTVQAVNAVGVSEVSAPACAKIELPETPANLVATATSDTEIALTWDEIPGIWSYNVYQVVEVEGETTYEFVGEAWWIEFTVTGLTAETEYSFVVRSVSNVGESANSNVATAKTLEAPKAPAAPVVEAEATSDTTIVLTWATVEGALSYNVYQGEDSIANVTDTTYTVTGLTADTEYTFTVTAINKVGESEASNEAKAKTNAAPVVPTVPAAPIVEVVEVTETTIVFAWAPVEGALSYNVYQGEDSIANVTDTTYTVTGLTANTEYCFTVTAVNEVGESAASEEVCATTKPDAIAENAAAFNIYPNPVADRLFIETEANVEEVTIYTLTGVMVYSEVDFNNNSINVSELNGGVYIMKVRTENGEAVQRFIKK